MSTLAIAYLVAWVGVSGYVGFLAARNRSLSRRLQALETSTAESSLAHRQSRAA